MILLMGSSDDCFGSTEAVEPQHNALEEGYICEGSASAMTHKTGWMDDSEGPCYGNGRRYEYEEIPTLTKVPSKHDR